MGSFDDKYGFNRTYGEENYEFYEDTHDENGQYQRRLREFTASNNSGVQMGREDTFTPRPNNIVSGNTQPSATTTVATTAEPTEEVKQEAKPEQSTEQKKKVHLKNVIVYEPEVEKEAQAIINCLKTSEPIIIKMDNTDDEVAQRIIDFVAGAIYATDGLIKKLSNKVFLAVPPSVKVLIPEGEENNG